MNRWILEMRDFQCKIEYKPGSKNVVADQLSQPVRVLGEGERWLGKTKDKLVEVQRAEPRWNDMIEYLKGGRIPRARYPRATLDQFTLEDQLLYLCKQKGDGIILYLLVVPLELRKTAMNHIHDRGAGHLGQHKNILKAEEYFCWPYLKQDVRRYVKECVSCHQFKVASGLQQH